MFTLPCIFSLKSRPLLRTPLVERGFAEHSVSENLPLSYSKTLLSALFSSPLLCSPPNASPFPHLTLRHEEFTQKSTPDPFGTHRFYSEHKVWWCRCVFCVCVHPVCVYPRVLSSLYVKRLHLRESLGFFFSFLPMPGGWVRVQRVRLSIPGHCICVYLYLSFCLIPLSLCPT